METAYAQALVKITAKGMKPKEAVDALRQLLVRSGREALLPRIGRAYARIAQREQGRTGVVLTVARESDRHAAQKQVSAILSDMNVEMKDVVLRTDESLIGGWRLEGRERLVDASFKKYLLDMYNAATTGIST